jgi:hypothetical protein
MTNRDERGMLFNLYFFLHFQSHFLFFPLGNGFDGFLPIKKRGKWNDWFEPKIFLLQRLESNLCVDTFHATS